MVRLGEGLTMRTMPEPCLCGADDCRHCYPSHFVQVGRRWVYMDPDKTEEELQRELDRWDDEVDARIDRARDGD